MLREEKFGAGMADQKELDAQLAKAIITDGKFENDLEYMDDNAERLGRKKMRTDAMKRQFAINGKPVAFESAICLPCFTQTMLRPKRCLPAVSTVMEKTILHRKLP